MPCTPSWKKADQNNNVTLSKLLSHIDSIYI
jgi:hypothetical protein